MLMENRPKAIKRKKEKEKERVMKKGSKESFYNTYLMRMNKYAKKERMRETRVRTRYTVSA